MGLFSKRQKRQSRRALRRAHTKALKAQAQAERKFAGKNAKKAEKAARKAARKGKAGASTAASGISAGTSALASSAAAAPAAVLDKKAQRSAAKDAKKAAAEARKAAERKQLSPAKVRRYLAVGRVVVPVLSPLLYRGATQLRGALDERRARTLGVDVENLAEFTGHGARLSARIHGLETSLAELDRGNVGAAGTEAAALASRDREFEQATTARLTELTTAVHAAERMPTARRRAAHTAIGTELDRIDAELLRRLGVR
jgi:hypothetical protein